MTNPNEKITRETMAADWDWCSAFHEAKYHHYGSDPQLMSFITDVYYAVEGEPDEENWIAVVGWDGPEGKFAIVDAGCDYTGWD